MECLKCERVKEINKHLIEHQEILATRIAEEDNECKADLDLFNSISDSLKCDECIDRQNKIENKSDGDD